VSRLAGAMVARSPPTQGRERLSVRVRRRSSFCPFGVLFLLYIYSLRVQAAQICRFETFTGLGRCVSEVLIFCRSMRGSSILWGNLGNTPKSLENLRVLDSIHFMKLLEGRIRRIKDVFEQDRMGKLTQESSAHKKASSLQHLTTSSSYNAWGVSTLNHHGTLPSVTELSLQTNFCQSSSFFLLIEIDVMLVG
jgi:hypothetical protein